MRRLLVVFVLSVLIFTGVVVPKAIEAHAARYPAPPTGLPSAPITHVVDGDTADVTLNGATERLRLIGIDTPETKDPRVPVQCYGREAATYAAMLLGEQTVRIETDRSQDSRDRYGRMLAYIWLADGRLFNLEMVAGGFAHEYTYESPYKYQAEFKQAQRDAQAGQRGFWSPTTCNGNTTQAATPPAPVQQDPRCFPETNQCISGRFRQYWEQNGGLAVFGLPITGVSNELNADGNTYQTQWFERNRFELHPENSAPYDVLLGRLGDDRLIQLGRNWQIFPKGQQSPSCLWFNETGHGVCEPFKSYWEGHGLQDPTLNAYGKSLALFGLPISEAIAETNASGASVVTQWFERARFECHPNNPPEHRVLLGLLGSEVRNKLAIPTGAPPLQCMATPVPVQPTTPAHPQCSPAYPDVCIPPPPPDLNCPDIPHRNFRVLPPDPHRFDSDGNGIGCENVTSPPPAQPAPQPTPRPQPTTPPPAQNCHPSYPTVCIPPPPPDLDCGDIPYRRFPVQGSDPHRFDSDNDGIGCES